MPKTITSPSKLYSGTVTLPDFLTYPQLSKVMLALHETEKIKAEYGSGSLTDLDTHVAWIPAIIACVEAWELAGIPKNPTVDTLPASPRDEMRSLIALLIDEIIKVFKGETELPPG